MKFSLALFFLCCFTPILTAQVSLRSFQQINEFGNKHITSITQDEVGYLILGTKNNGIIYFDGKETNVFDDKSGLISNQINSLCYKNDSLLIATKKGLSIKRNNRFSTVTTDEIYGIYTLKNKLYVTSNKGISVVKKGTLEVLRLPSEMYQQKINDIIFDGTRFWIATEKKLFQIDNLENPRQVISIAKGNFTSLLLNTNKLIVSELKNGLWLVNEAQLGAKINSNTNILKVRKIKNQLWLFLKDNGIELISERNYTFIKKINKYNSTISSNATEVYQDAQQTIWLGTDTGAYQLNPINTALQIEKTPRVFLTNIEVVYQPVDSINFNTYQNTLQLSATQQHLSFSFKTVDLAEPNSITYRYKLKNKFSPWSKKSTVNFANLEAGMYSFYYQSKKGNMESDLNKFSFNIHQPFYKKTIFLVILGIVLLMVILLISIVYTNRIQQKNKVKVAQLQLENHLIALEQKAMQLQMNPHFIFNVLNGIKAYGISGNKNKLSETISKFAKLLRSVLNSSKQDTISLQSEIETLENYMELAQEISPFSFDFIIEKALKNVSEEEILIPPMLLQPLVENAIQHGFTSETKENKISISFENENGFLYCTVQDNGIGVFTKMEQDAHKNHKSLAIAITKERIKNTTKYHQFTMKEIKENNTIAGTKISFKIPLKTDY